VYDWRVGTSIWERLDRATQTTTDESNVGANANAMRSTLDGRWVKTMVLIRPNRRASGTAATS